MSADLAPPLPVHRGASDDDRGGTGEAEHDEVAGEVDGTAANDSEAVSRHGTAGAEHRHEQSEAGEGAAG